MIIFESQISLPLDAVDSASPVRLSQVSTHLADSTLHLPAGGSAGQVLVMTASGPAWKWPVITDNSITFSDEEPT